MYNTLDKLPIKTFYSIIETENYQLLIEKNDNPLPYGLLKKTWDDLFFEYNEKYGDLSSIQSKVKLQIESLNAKQMSLSIACECLKFDYNEDLILLLKENGIILNDDENYLSRLEEIERQLSDFNIKINKLKDTLPKNENEPFNIDDVLAGISSMLQIDFDFNKISVSKFYSLQKQVENKIKKIKQEISKIE